MKTLQKTTAFLCFCLFIAVPASASPQSGGTFTTIDVPGAGTGVLQGTLPLSINAAGGIAGIYIVAPNVAHGFVRVLDGAITKIDVPGAGTGMNQGTFVISINGAGAVTGMYADNNSVYHGFVITAVGEMIYPIDAPGAGTTGHRGTTPLSIDAAGDITGTYTDESALRHAFVRAANGTMTTFEVSGAGNVGSVQGQGTQPLSINSAGEVTGFYVDANGGFHGFLRSANGTVTAPIDVPGSGTSGGSEHHMDLVGTIPTTIDATGDIAGIYTDADGVRHAFLRAANGTITHPIDAPGAGTTGVISGTLPFSINSAAEIAGAYQDTGGLFHGFARLASGAIISPIDAVGAGAAGSSLFPGTACSGVNDSGEVTGVYADATGAFHGFLLSNVTTTASVSPGALSFGNQAVGIPSAAVPVTLSNTGIGALTITTILATGDFSQTNTCGAGVAEGHSCAINVTFKPTELGIRSGTLTMVDNAVNSPQVVRLSGMGTTVEISTSALNFGDQTVGTTSKSQVVTLTNVASSPLRISGIGIGPMWAVERRVQGFITSIANQRVEFAQTNNCPASLAQGARCSISVTFSPQTAGSAQSWLAINDTGLGSPQRVRLSGIGQ